MKKTIKIYLINFLCLLFLEFTFGLLVFGGYGIRTLLGIIIYALFSSSIITLLTTIWSEKVNRIINYIIYFVICFWFALEYVFKSFLQTFFSLSMFKLTDQAMGFLGKTLNVIFSNIFYIILFFVPFIMFIVFRKKINYNINRKNVYVIVCILLIMITYGTYSLYLYTQKGSSLSMYDLYYNIDNTALSKQKLGILSSTGIDFYRNIFGFDEVIKDTSFYNNNKVNYNERNVLDLDLTDKKLNDKIKKVLESNPGAGKNSYTGYFKGKNLIFVVAESFSEIAVDKDITPTLYKLTNNGFVFNNFYVPYYLSTIGGEFQSLTGIYPDSSTLSIWKEGRNSFPYGLSTVFEGEGYNTFAYHGHDGHFQSRYKYLKAIGFDNFKACNMGLDIDCGKWPESDVEMILNTYSDYINSDKPFMAYYMTVSGHFDYNDSNDIVMKNKKLVDNLSYSDKAKAYLATQIELDRALELLINKLEESGKLDDTVIVLIADHYPYGLTLDEINELSNYERDDLFEINHNSLVIWNSTSDREEIDKVGMPIDVIPTVYNLFGINYDSRLFAGTDLFSSTEGLVILNNRSWITDRGRYDSTTDTYSGTYDSDYINYVNDIIQNKIVFSKNMITYDGYKYIKIN